jgi:hypothetical protein
MSLGSLKEIFLLKCPRGFLDIQNLFEATKYYFSYIPMAVSFHSFEEVFSE